MVTQLLSHAPSRRRPMTLRQFLAGLAGLLWIMPPLFGADATTQSARIQRARVEVRAGPSEKFPITTTLQLGDVVYLRATSPNNGWLEIVPPTGSISWIPDRVVQPVGNPAQTLAVVPDEVPLRVGGSGFSFPLDVEANVKVKNGAILYVRGEKVIHEKAAWWPVAPARGESRYILAEAITAPAVASAKVTPGNSAGTTTT